ncbi:hypothetical protein ACHWQZ_G018210 [Mnemiopsis leidyi]
MLQLTVLLVLIGPIISGCPNGYDHYIGDIPGWGTYLGSALKVPSVSWCARLCDALTECLSFEHSNSSDLCNLNTGATPTVSKYMDYAFCKKRAPKSGCPAGYRAEDADVPGWGTYLGSRRLVGSREICALMCTSWSDCYSFEHSNSDRICNINTSRWPSRGPYKDYQFCTKN